MRQSRVEVSCKFDSSLSTIIYHLNGSSFLLSQNDEHCGHCEGCEARKSVFICNAAKRFVNLSVTKSESVTLWKRWGRLFSHQFHFFGFWRADAIAAFSSTETWSENNASPIRSSYIYQRCPRTLLIAICATWLSTGLNASSVCNRGHWMAHRICSEHWTQQTQLQWRDKFASALEAREKLVGTASGNIKSI